MTVENGSSPTPAGAADGGAVGADGGILTPPAEGQDNGDVVLSKEQYEAVLDHIATLESKVINATPQGQQNVQTLDSLINEGDGAPRGEAAPAGAKLEDMSPEQVMNHIFHTIHKQYVEPLEIKFETLRLMNEIDKVAAKPENADFWDYAGLVKEIAMKNPGLSIQRAYNLAKAEGKGKSGTQGDPGLVKKSDLLFTLPKRPGGSVQGGGGEKPTGVAHGITRSSGELTRRDAASEAFDKATKGK